MNKTRGSLNLKKTNVSTKLVKVDFRRIGLIWFRSLFSVSVLIYLCLSIFVLSEFQKALPTHAIYNKVDYFVNSLFKQTNCSTVSDHLHHWLSNSRWCKLLRKVKTWKAFRTQIMSNVVFSKESEIYIIPYVS